LVGVPEAATFVFTDLVGSTALSAALDRDEAEQLRHAHFGVLRATATANEVFELTTRMGITFAQTIYGAALLRIYLEQGRLGEIVDLARQTAAENPTLPGWRLAIMFMCCQVGRSSEAAALFDHEMSTGLSELPFDVTWLQSMSYLADCAADLGRPDAALLLYGRFAP
jgi:hypothetical protein